MTENRSVQAAPQALWLRVQMNCTCEFEYDIQPTGTAWFEKKSDAFFHVVGLENGKPLYRTGITRAANISAARHHALYEFLNENSTHFQVRTNDFGRGGRIASGLAFAYLFSMPTAASIDNLGFRIFVSNPGVKVQTWEGQNVTFVVNEAWKIEGNLSEASLVFDTPVWGSFFPEKENYAHDAFIEPLYRITGSTGSSEFRRDDKAPFYHDGSPNGTTQPYFGGPAGRYTVQLLYDVSGGQEILRPFMIVYPMQ